MMLHLAFTMACCTRRFSFVEGIYLDGGSGAGGAGRRRDAGAERLEPGVHQRLGGLEKTTVVIIVYKIKDAPGAE
jgi:hypothetical protein